MAESIDPDDTISYDDPSERLDRDRDGIASLRDTDEEQGDETEVTDEFDLDETAARETDTALDRIGGETPLLD